MELYRLLCDQPSRFGDARLRTRRLVNEAGAMLIDAKESTMSHLQRGDHVAIHNLGVNGEVIEVDTRSIVVRYKKADGELVEHRFQADDLTYIPKPHLE